MRSPRFRVAPFVLSVSLLILLFTASPPLHAQGYRVVCQDAGILPNELRRDSDGTFYGTTRGGGKFGAGTIFKMDANCGNKVTLHEFAGHFGDDAGNPRGPVVIGSDGFLYGATYTGGDDDYGTVFKIGKDGNNYSFTSLLTPMGLCGSTGDSPHAGPFLASDGQMYVPMTICGPLGANGSSAGTVASMTTGLSVSATGYFDPHGDINQPYHTLVEGPDNMLYGMARESYFTTQHYGAIYKVGLGGGDPQLVHAFAGPEGATPDAPVSFADDGSLWGTTSTWTDTLTGPGTLFRIDGGGFTLIHRFEQNPEGAPGEHQSVAQGPDGYMYGMTTGPTGFEGIVFRVALDGTFTKIANVVDTDIGIIPYRPYFRAPDGKLWGQTTNFAGPGSYYTIDTTQWIDAIAPSTGPASGGTTVTISGAGFTAGAEVRFGAEGATGENVPDAQHVTAVTPATLAAGQLYTVKVILLDGTRILLNEGFMADFLDVPSADIFHPYVEAVLRNGITAGCGGGNYCRDAPVRRDQMAVFLLKAEHGASYVPPDCKGVFPDVACPSPFAGWVEQLAAEGITTGCGGGNYCPSASVTRAQMAVFLLKTEHGSAYTPPACAGIFGDVACPSPFADWIENLYAENVTGGCSASPLLYCPGNSNTRGQMAVFISKTFGLL